LVEHVTENHGVGGSIPPLGTIFIEHGDHEDPEQCHGDHAAEDGRADGASAESSASPICA
jgi:hypothetical protein